MSVYYAACKLVESEYPFMYSIYCCFEYNTAADNCAVFLLYSSMHLLLLFLLLASDDHQKSSKYTGLMPILARNNTAQHIDFILNMNNMLSENRTFSFLFQFISIH